MYLKIHIYMHTRLMQTRTAVKEGVSTYCMWAKDSAATPAKAKEHDCRVASLNNVLQLKLPFLWL